jgi:hypothetical protein
LRKPWYLKTGNKFWNITWKMRYGTTGVPLSKKTWKAALFTSEAIFMANPNILLSQEQESWLIVVETMKMWPYSTGYACRGKNVYQ